MFITFALSKEIINMLNKKKEANEQIRILSQVL